MMKTIKLLSIAAILLLFVGGCAKTGLEDNDDGPVNKDGSIAFLTDSFITKGVPHDDLKAYSKVDLFTYSHAGKYAAAKSLYRKIALNKEAGTTPPSWSYSPPMFWPDKLGLSFLAHSSDMPYAAKSGDPGVFIKGDGSAVAPTIEYYVPSDVTKQPDLLVTALIDHPKASNVTLPMKHALACVSFCATGLPGMTVKSIKLNKVYCKAALSLDDATITWKVDPASKGLVALNPGFDSDEPLQENPTDGNYLMTADGYMMMIPQALTDATIDVTYVKADKTEITTNYKLPTEVVWTPGNKYIYKFGENLEEVVVYYEKYADNSYGVHTIMNTSIPKSLDETNTKKIVEAGYGVLTKSALVSSNPKIRLGSATAITTKKVTGVVGGYDLYAVNQTGTPGVDTFVLPATPTPVEVFFDGNSTACGKIIPQFAKGVNDWNPVDYAIRTPQQMRNISALTTGDDWNVSAKIFNQESDLDFSVLTIGGGTLNGPVVDQTFCGTYNGKQGDKARSISNVTINAPTMDYVGLFSQSHGQINDIMLKSSSITGQDYVAGVVGYLYGGAGAVNRPQIIGTSSSAAGLVTIKGRTNVGGIVANNVAFITGNPELVAVTEVTVAEISGWVNITGSGNVGGIVGVNSGVISKVLVNGVNVVNSTDAKVNITGTDQVGGIAGINWATIDGNMTGEGANVKNMPDVAGIVEIRGVNWVGGITGMNASTGKLNSVNIRLGRTTPMKITGSGIHVGGIAGENGGTLGVESDKTFISTRGNIEISGSGNVGGIVGTNSAGATLKNCFVYNFFTQGAGKRYYAPKIICSGSNAGGIAGRNAASINDCSVFTADQNTQLTITASANAGGIAGVNDSNGKTELCSVIGKVEVTLPIPAGNIPWEVSLNAGGICGVNYGGTTISQCWIGSSDGKNIIGNAVSNLGLVITPPDEPAVKPSYGIPTIKGKKYIGGIVGLNDGGIIENILLADNVIIGVADGVPAVNTGSDWVGGIAGGNTPSYLGTNNVIRNCKVTNLAGKSIVIQGATNLGGIVGLNNGVVDGCEVSGVAGNPLTITGLGTMGGIVGQVGGHTSIISTELGNNYTAVNNCKVTGYVTIAGNQGGWGIAWQVGGIVGLLGPTTDSRNNLSRCEVRGAAANSISVTSGGTVGGVVGKNSGNILSCDVYNTAVTSTLGIAGGITAYSFCNSSYPATAPNWHADLNDCRVYSATISGAGGYGVWIGLIDTGPVTGSIAFGRTNANYVFTTPIVGKTTSFASITYNCSSGTVPPR